MSTPAKPDGEREIETVTSADGTELVYERSGSGPPLVLVHGAIFDRSIWELGGVRSTFADSFTVYAMDRRSHGDSESSDDFHPETQFDDIVAVVESIDEPVHLLGHSAGATFALWAAARTDNLRSLILHEPVGTPSGEAGDAVGEMLALLEDGQNEQALTVFVGELAQCAPDELAELRSSPLWDAHVETFPQVLMPQLEASMEYDWDIARFEDLTTPTLLLAGSESGFREMAERLHETIPNSRLVVLEGAGHASHLVDPDRYTDEVLSFIEDVD